VLAIPDASVHRTKIADWLELKAIASPDARVGFGTLVSATALGENEQEPDIGDEDAEEEGLVLCVQTEINRRLENVGDDYPFRIDDKGRALNFITPVSEAGSVYLFCLFLSHAFDNTIVGEDMAPVVNNKIRDLFQACATIAAGGYIQGPSMSFGFPRPDGMDFLKALRKVYKLFGDGRPCARPRKAAPPKVKDNGIDIIAWRWSIDHLPGMPYLIGQVASGNDWVVKSVKADREHFHKYWFVEHPSSQPEDAMFMPFGLEPENATLEVDYEALLKDYMSSSNYRFGNLFYRDRIAKHVAIGLQLIANGETHIQRRDDLQEVTKWVEEYALRLRAA
jgi:hypothetical protein